MVLCAITQVLFSTAVYAIEFFSPKVILHFIDPDFLYLSFELHCWYGLHLYSQGVFKLLPSILQTSKSLIILSHGIGVSDQQIVGLSSGSGTCVPLSKTLNHYCFVLWMGRKAVGPVCFCHARKRTELHLSRRGGACSSVSDSGCCVRHSAL